MLFYILNENLEKVAVIDSFKSAIWTDRYYTPGDFEIYTGASAEALDQFRLGRYVLRGDDTSQAAIIEKVKLTTDAEEGDHITITGRNVQALLSRRIVWAQSTYIGKAEAAIRKLIERAMISPDIAARTVPGFMLGTPAGLAEEVNAQFYGDDLGAAVQGICKEAGIGYRIEFDASIPGFVFTIYKGSDRSSDQSENPLVIFSPEFDNLLSTEYIKSSESFRNVAQVAGEGMGTAKQIVSVGTASGWSRFETRVDGSNASTNSEEFSAATYAGMLEQQGREALAKLKNTEAMSGAVLQSQFKIGVDYFLGDIVETRSHYGQSVKSRVTEVVESWAEDGHTILPTFAEI